MVIRVRFSRREQDGKETIVELEDGVEDSFSSNELKLLWDAERAINETGALRCHIELEEPAKRVDIAGTFSDNQRRRI